jgi:hypothetical protein
MGVRSVLSVSGVVVLLLAGCGDGDADPAATPVSTPAPTASPGPSATGSAPPSDATTAPDEEAAVIEDGTHPAFVTEVDVAARTVTIDVVQFLTGQEAADAAEEDGEESPPPNDYYIRNTSSRLRTLPVSDDATITVNTLSAAETGSSTEDLDVDLDKLSSYDLEGALFWVTAADEEVTGLAQQYLP